MLGAGCETAVLKLEVTVGYSAELKSEPVGAGAAREDEEEET